ncbi:MAG: 50S ribosomal protein L24 [Clostridiales bacterium]|jgi:ribosomal protein L24|nr:50S ribosomal protein L24 [Clostridiales bacterium]
MSSLHVKKGDNVLILAGKDKGQSGRIVAVNPGNGRVVVDGRNIITRHKKARSAKETSAVERINGSIDGSNVQIICPSCNKATRVAVVFGETPAGGKKPAKIRTCKKCGASLDAKSKSDKTVKEAKKSVKKAAKGKAGDKAEIVVPESAVTEKPAKKSAVKKPETETVETKKPETKTAETKTVETVTAETEKPETEKAPTKKPAAKKTEAAEKPETEKPAAKKPAAKKAEAAEKPETEKPAAKKPAAKKAEAAEKPETEKAPTKKPAAKKAEAKKPETGGAENGEA